MEKANGNRINTAELVKGILCLICSFILFVPMIVFGILLTIGTGITEGLGTIIGGLVVFGLALWFSIDIFRNKVRQAKITPNQSEVVISGKVATETFELMDIASKLQFLGKYDEALELYKQVTAKEEYNAFAWKGVGDMSAQLDDYQGAIDAYDRYLYHREEGLPHDVNDYLNLGIFYQKINNTIRATMAFEKAIRIDPMSTEARFLLVFEQNRQEYEAQVIVFEGAIEIEKRFKEPYIKLGALQRKWGFTNKALDVYKKAFEVFGKDDVDILNEYGGLLFEQNKFSEAIQEFNKVIVIKPNHWEALGQLGQCYAYLKEKKKAITYTQKAIEFNQANPDLLNNLGLFYFHDEQIDHSIQALRKALSFDPSHENANKNLQLVLKEIEAIEHAGILKKDEINKE